MKVLLLKTVPKIGKKDAVVEVSLGFANNALFPQKLAIPATPAAIAAVERTLHNREESKAIQHNLLDRAIESIQGRSLIMPVSASGTGSLFAKIDSGVIADFLMSEHRITIAQTCIILPEGPIKKTGTYSIDIVDGEYKTTLSLTINKK